MRVCCSVFLYTICYFSCFGFYSQNLICRYIYVWQSLKLSFIYFTKFAFLLGAPVQIQHDLWKQPNISHMWLEKKPEESLLSLIYDLLPTRSFFKYFIAGLDSITHGVFFNLLLFAKKVSSFQIFHLFNFVFFNLFLLLFRTLTAQIILFIPLYSSQIFSPWWLAPLLKNSL